MNRTDMFKMYDIRTKYENPDDQEAERLVAAIARYYKESLKTDSVFLGRDARLHCAMLMEKVLEIFPKYGIEILYNPVQISTCQFYYSCMRNRRCGGIMATASHNPKEYIGFKLLGPDLYPIAMDCGPEGGIRKVRQNYIENLPVPENAQPAAVHVRQYQNEYVDYSMKLAGVRPGDFKGMKIFGEFLSGSSGTDFALAMDRAGAETVLSHSVPDGLFPCGNPNPVEEASIGPAREKMRNGNFDIGFCFDGDGDRMDLMYPDGTQIIPGLNMSVLVPYIKKIFSPYLGETFPLQVYADLKAVPPALVEISGKGVGHHIIRNGHSYVKQKLKEHLRDGYVAAEEESSHYYMNFPYDPEDLSKGFAATENTLFYSLLTVRALKENRENYARIRELQKGVFRHREWSLHFNDPKKMEDILVEVETAIRDLGAVTVDRMDDGSALDAVLMRFRLPEKIGADTVLAEDWCQVSQRISRSEDAVARWEVVAPAQKLCDKMNGVIRQITDRYAEKGLAHY